MKKKTLIDALAWALIIFFVYTASSTYIQLKSLRNMLTFYTEHRNFFAGAIVLSYISVSVCLFFRKLRLLGFILAACIAIALYVTIQLTPHNPHDFGGIFNTVSETYKLGILLLISTISVIAILLRYLEWRSQRHGIDNATQPVFN